MEKLRKACQELEKVHGASPVKYGRLEKFCRHAGVPCVTVYLAKMLSGGFSNQAQRAYVFTKRKDAREFIWYLNDNLDLKVYDRDGKNGVPFEKWDPEAYLFTHRTFDDGSTMNLVERERQRRNAENSGG